MTWWLIGKADMHGQFLFSTIQPFKKKKKHWVEEMDNP